MNHQIPLTARGIREFRIVVYRHYNTYGRELPWRQSTDPYEILISEVMLQQTQVRRVIPKYAQFLRAYPDIKSLAAARLHNILKIWRGLGYNRRALALKRLAEVVVREFDGEIPSQAEALMTLPGIGRATAHAICAFAFNRPVVFIETNIRTVFIHHFFGNRAHVKDTEIIPLVEQTLDAERPRLWYWALMDFGAALKREHANPSRTSAHYQKQTPFRGSNRQVRGMILKVVVREIEVCEEHLISEIPFSAKAVQHNLKQLEKEGFIVRRGAYIAVAEEQ